MRKRTEQFLGKKYPIGTNEHFLKVGDKVIIHPTKYSQAQKPYMAIITNELILWDDYPSIEICTYVEGKYSAVMNEYLFNRLEYHP